MTAAEQQNPVYEIDVPMIQERPGGPLVPPLNANRRLHWRPERKRIKDVREAVAESATLKKIPTCQHIAVQLHYRPGDNRKRDASNYMRTQKPALDGLVQAGVVPDDDKRYVTEHLPELHPGPGKRRLWLTIEVIA